MKHGPIALIDENLPVVAIATGDQRLREGQEQHAGSQGPRRHRDRRCTDRDPEELGGIADDIIQVPDGLAALQPIVNVIPLQLLAYFIGVRRGADVDQPRNLAKSVTVE